MYQYLFFKDLFQLSQKITFKKNGVLQWRGKEQNGTRCVLQVSLCVIPVGELEDGVELVAVGAEHRGLVVQVGPRLARLVRAVVAVPLARKALLLAVHFGVPGRRTCKKRTPENTRIRRNKQNRNEYPLGETKPLKPNAKRVRTRTGR